MRLVTFEKLPPTSEDAKSYKAKVEQWRVSTAEKLEAFLESHKIQEKCDMECCGEDPRCYCPNCQIYKELLEIIKTRCDHKNKRWRKKDDEFEVLQCVDCGKRIRSINVKYLGSQIHKKEVR